MDTVVNITLARQISTLTLEIGAVSFNTKKPFRYTSGILSPMYTDNRLFMSHPKAWQTVIQGYISVLKSVQPLKTISVLSGTATAGIPHAAAIAYALHMPMVYVRSSKKEHGKENLIEGIFSRKSRVLIIEDIVSTGLSTVQNCRAIRGKGGIADSCIAITTTTRNAYEKAFSDNGITLYTLTDIDTTLDIALKTKRITGKQRASIEAFVLDPVGWGKKMGFS